MSVVETKLAAGMSIAATATGFVSNSMSVPLTGVPLTVLFMCAAGSFGSFVYTEKKVPRKQLFAMATIHTILAAAAVVLVPAYYEWAWATDPKVQAPLGFVLAFSFKWIIPLLIENGPTWVRNMLPAGFVKSKNQTPGDAP